MDGLTFRRFDTAGARAMRGLSAEIHQDAYAEEIAAGNPFETQEAYLRRFDSYTSQDGFDLVLAHLGEEPVGQAYGWPLSRDTGWWGGLDAEPEPGFTDEDGQRTFALSELMVCRAHAGQGIGRALHDELLRPRREKRATLLVVPGNDTAYPRYTRWGWHKAAQLRPAWDNAPLFDVLMLQLPARPADE